MDNKEKLIKIFEGKIWVANLKEVFAHEIYFMHERTKFCLSFHPGVEHTDSSYIILAMIDGEKRCLLFNESLLSNDYKKLCKITSDLIVILSDNILNDIFEGPHDEPMIKNRL